MTIKKFLSEISDEKGPLQCLASELMERMSKKDFMELYREIKRNVEVEKKTVRV